MSLDRGWIWLLSTFVTVSSFAANAGETPPPWPGDEWRAHHRIIDLHEHIDGAEDRVLRAVRILDRVGVGVGVNLSGGTVTHKPGEMSEFERTKSLEDRLAPGHFVNYFNLDYAGWDDADFSARAVDQVNEAYRLGAAGFKEYKRLGLTLRNGAGELIRIDDPKLDPVWERCGQLHLPVSIHVADPKAFWLPYSQRNERWDELKDHPKWWFGDPKQFPRREELLAALDRVIVRHPGTTFVCVHFANNAEDLDWVERMLSTRPNMNADLAARIPELGRHNPARLRSLFTRFQDRIFFATDFQVYERLILGSSGDAERPTDDDAAMFYHKEWRWLETVDQDWPHMTPIQGGWNINSIGLRPEVLRKIYFDNARRLLVRSMPASVLRAKRVERDIPLTEVFDSPEWKSAETFPIEQETESGQARPELSTPCRALWSQQFLYLTYESPYTRLTDYGPAQPAERIQPGKALWDKDVVEAFFISDTNRMTSYTEYEWAPNGDSLDLKIDLPKKDFQWSSGMESLVRVDSKRGIWTCVARIPLKSLAQSTPEIGTRWRANVYRIDRAHKAFLAMNPTIAGSFHTVDRFGWLEFTR